MCLYQKDREKERQTDRQREETDPIGTHADTLFYLSATTRHKQRQDFPFSFLVPPPGPTGRMCWERGPLRSRWRHGQSPAPVCTAALRTEAPAKRLHVYLRKGRICSLVSCITERSPGSSGFFPSARVSPFWAGTLPWLSSYPSSPLLPVEVQTLTCLVSSASSSACPPLLIPLPLQTGLHAAWGRITQFQHSASCCRDLPPRRKYKLLNKTEGPPWWLSW